MENAVILWIVVKMYALWLTSTRRKRKKFKNYRKCNKDLNDLIEKKFQRFVTNKKRMKTEKKLQHFQEM